MSTAGKLNIAASEKGKFLTKTYAWMALALVLSAASAWYGATSPFILTLLWGNPLGSRTIGFIILSVAELALVWGLSALIRKISPAAAIFMFALYSIINGLTLSSVFLVFSISSIGWCFLSAAGMFLIMSIYGLTTKQSLARAGHYLMMALVGVIVVSIVNFIITRITGESVSYIDWLISIATVVIFTGLTAFDSQKILAAAERADSGEAYRKIAVIGALELYLDFINIFLALLRLFGKSRD